MYPREKFCLCDQCLGSRRLGNMVWDKDVHTGSLFGMLMGSTTPERWKGFRDGWAEEFEL